MTTKVMSDIERCPETAAKGALKGEHRAHRIPMALQKTNKLVGDGLR